MESNALPPDSLRVAVFAKAPVAGTVKTRLAPVLGLEGAARLHARLVEHALEEAVAARVGPVELWCAPDMSHAFFAECARRHALRLRPQCEGDLGLRMAHAFASVVAEGSALILIGSDCPALDRTAIGAAAHALASHPAVIAPAEDGGYGLIALRREFGALFEGISWGTATVMAETRLRLASSGIRWHELPRTWDVDRPEDYARLRREPKWAEELA